MLYNFLYRSKVSSRSASCAVAAAAHSCATEEERTVRVSFTDDRCEKIVDCKRCPRRDSWVDTEADDWFWLAERVGMLFGIETLSEFFEFASMEERIS